MSYNAQGLRNLGPGGTISDATATGGTVTANLFHYITDDDESAIETDGYFDTAYQLFNHGGTDVMFVTADRNGTPVGLSYIVKRTAGDIALVTFKGGG